MDKDIHHPHDTGYKYLLSSKKTFIQLLRSFIDRDWVHHIDESRLVKLDKSYILPDFSQKEADLVYQLSMEDQDVIFYVLLELQSTVDYQMPYRLLLYQIEVWRDILKNTKRKTSARKGFRLPALSQSSCITARRNGQRNVVFGRPCRAKNCLGMNCWTSSTS